MEEVKDVTQVDFSNNGIIDITPMNCIINLVRLNLANNRIKSMSIFGLEDAFLNLKWLDISNNKFTELSAIKC